MKKLIIVLISIFAILISSCSKKNENTEISKKDIEVKSITIDPKEIIIQEGESREINTEILPADATNKECKWFTEDANTASINEKGIITAIKEGKTSITVSSSNNKTAICNITVTAKPISVVTVSIEKKEYKIQLASSMKLIAIVHPDNATNKNISWLSKDESIVSVSTEGIITGIKIGTTTVIATSEDGNKNAECTVIVENNNNESICKDKDGKIYKTVQIGEQLWMAENLAYLTSEMLVNKTAFVYDYTDSDISNAKSLENYINYGVLYTFEEAEKSVPIGWHLPTDAEFMELEQYIGMSKEESEMDGTRGDYSYKIMRKDFWLDTTFEITNETGFSAVPSGYRSAKGEFGQINKRTVFWGARYDTDKSKGRAIFNNRAKINRSDAKLTSGYSVRCIKNK